jgi:peptide/nickel transport system ATP-binding protein
MLNVCDLTKVYAAGISKRKGVVAVDKVSFDVNRGEMISLVGESGSGKTTTAHIILHLLPSTSGRVVFEGKDIWSFRKRKGLKKYWREVHGIFQDPYASYNPMYKADRILYQALDLLGKHTDNRKKIVKEALEGVQLRAGDIAGKYSHELSGGQRQRLMIARCYILKPKLIVADEPVSMVDASGRAGILKLFSELRDRYKTAILFITHDLGLAYYMSDRILVMHRGKIVEEGVPEALLSNPQHSYTRKLIADIPLLHSKWSDI